MPYQASTAPVPVRTRPERAAQPAHRAASGAPSAPPVSPEGIGDIMDAGRPSGYAHLSGRGAPTVGRLVAAARGAALALHRPARWPSRRDRWQAAPRPARRHAGGRLRITAIALEPNSFAPCSSSPAAGAASRPGAPRSEVLYLVSGRAHLITAAPGGQMRAASELSCDRARVLGAGPDAYLVNTGAEVAVIVRVTA